MTIQTRLSWLTVGLVLPLVLLGFYYLWRGHQTSREQLSDSLTQQAELAATAFEQWVEAQRQGLETIVELSERGDTTVGSDFLRSVLRTRPHWYDVEIVDEAGKVLRYQSAGETSLPPMTTRLVLPEERSHVALIVRSEQFSDESLRIIYMAMPLPNNRFVVARMDGTSASDIFKRLQLPEDHVIAVIASNGKLIYRNNVSPSQMEIDVSKTSMLSAAAERGRATIEIASLYDGVYRVYALATVPSAGCTVAVGVPSSTLYEAASQRFYRHLFIGGLVVLLAVVGAFLIARSITAPIYGLAGAARAFGSGELTARTEPSGGGALQELGITFNQMADKIATRETKMRELDRLKSEFVDSVSHELRTPLTTIKTFTRVLQSNSISQKERQAYLQTIAEECDRQIDFVQKLLDVSRIESGAYRPKFERVGIQELLRGITDARQRAVFSRGLKLTLEATDDITIETDPGLLERVLVSLVENSMNYTEPGGHILIGAYRGDDHVRIDVTDTGCGIAAEDIPRVFDRFYRGKPLDASAGNGHPGTGMGLYVVKLITDELGGSLVVNSPAPGSRTGARVSLVLPLDHQMSKITHRPAVITDFQPSGDV